MELEVIKKIIKDNINEHVEMVTNSMIAERYYKGKNDILAVKQEESDNPLRNADNKIPHNFHGLLVNQKSAYMFTYPPLFDAGNETVNAAINNVLGDKWAKTCKKLCINASNSSVAWLHIWQDDKTFKYEVVDSKQVIPIWGSSLEQELIGVLRTYKQVDDTGEMYDIYEYWNDIECDSFRKLSSQNIDEGLEFSFMFGNANGQTDVLSHDFGIVPFIPFFNNDTNTCDLDSIKTLIDTYDKVYSGFANDLEDIQEIIFILSNYEGENLSEFMTNIKKYKALKVQNNGPDDRSGVQTLTIDIPVEAREKLLTMTRKAIFEQGQGVDPDPNNFGNASGVALKYLYSLLELKAGISETEFRLGFGTFVRAICNYLNFNPTTILQTWTRSAIQNDLEMASICRDSVGVISNKSIRKAHPFVDDIVEEEKQIQKEEQNMMNDNEFSLAFDKGKENEE